jgi:hypothetical protein
MNDLVKADPQIEPTMLAKYGVDLAEIERIRIDCTNKSFDTPANYQDGTKALALARKTRTGIELRRKELKAESLEFGRRVDSTAKQLTALVAPIEDELQAKKDFVDNEKARVKSEKEAELERQRVARIEAARAEERAKEEARLEAIRVEQDRVAREQAEKEAELRRQQEAFESEQRRQREAIEAERRHAEAERLAAEQKAAAELRRQQEELQRQQRELEDQKRAAELEDAKRQAAILAEREATERAARERVEAEERRVAELESQAELKRREEVLLPDREKLAVWAEDIRQLSESPPGVTSDDAKEFIVRAQELLNEITDSIWGFGK